MTVILLKSGNPISITILYQEFQPRIKLQFSYLAETESITFAMLFIYAVIELVYRLYWKQNTDFFFLKLIFTGKPSLFGKSTANNNYQPVNFIGTKVLKFISVISYSSVIRQKSESQNMCYEKTKRANFSEKWTFLSLWYARSHVLIRG